MRKKGDGNHGFLSVRSDMTLKVDPEIKKKKNKQTIKQQVIQISIGK